MARMKGSPAVEVSRKLADGRFKDPQKGLKAKQERVWKKKQLTHWLANIKLTRTLGSLGVIFDGLARGQKKGFCSLKVDNYEK